jgi:hypothetical protein
MCTYSGPEIHDSDNDTYDSNLFHPFVHKREAATSTADKKAQEMFVEMYKVALKADSSKAREKICGWIGMGESVTEDWVIGELGCLRAEE